MAAEKEKMHLKKYISNSFVLRLSLLLALVAAAAVFDMYHSANRKLTEKINKIPVSDEIALKAAEIRHEKNLDWETPLFWLRLF